jgi:AcrR family transcriptional regulator
MARPRQITDEQISAAARAAFLAHGPATTVATIAATLGVSQAALFHRTGSKERLMLAALCPRPPGLFAELEAGPAPDRPAAEQLVDRLAALLGFLRELVPGLVVLRSAGLRVAEALGDREPPPLAARRLLARWLERAAASGALVAPHPAALAEALLGALEARCFNAHLGGEAFAPGEDLPFLRALVDALVPTPAQETTP